MFIILAAHQIIQCQSQLVCSWRQRKFAFIYFLPATRNRTFIYQIRYQFGFISMSDFKRFFISGHSIHESKD